MGNPFKVNHVTSSPDGALVFMRRRIKRGKTNVDEDVVIWDKNKNKKLDSNDLVLVAAPRSGRCPRRSVFKPGAEGTDFCRRKATARDVRTFGILVKSAIARAFKHRAVVKKWAKPMTTGMCVGGASLPFSPPLTLTSSRAAKSQRYTPGTNFSRMTTIDPRKCTMVGARMYLAIGGVKTSVAVWMSGPWNFVHAGALGLTRNPDAVHVTYVHKGIRYNHLDMHK